MEGSAAGEDHRVEREILREAGLLERWLPFLVRDLCHDCSRLLNDRVHHVLLSGELPVFDDENSLEDPSEEAGCSYEDGHWPEDPSEESASPYKEVSWRKNPAEATPPPCEDARCLENPLEATTTYEDGRCLEMPSEKPSPRYDDRHSQESPTKWTSSPQYNDMTSGKNSAETATPRYDDRGLLVAGNSATSSTGHRSWADMVQEDELEDLAALNSPADSSRGSGGAEGPKEEKRQSLSRSRREYIRFMNVRRKKDFICLERVNGKITNILEGLELHTGVFSAAEQKRIVDYIYRLQELGMSGKLRARTYSEPAKWMRGKGRVTIQFGCCYNYAQDRDGNPPGIMRQEVADPFPPLFKVMIRRLVKWHVLPPSCVPDSCIVNIYDVGDCIPPHIDHHDFVRPFCTISFLSVCNIVFGTNLKAIGAGEFAGAMAMPLPLGSVLILNGKAADVAKHCVPGVPSKRISVTFRRMDDSKRPIGFVPEPDLQDIQPLPYDFNQPRRSDFIKRLNPENFSVEKEQYQGHAFHSESNRFSGARNNGASRPRGGSRRSRR